MARSAAPAASQPPVIRSRAASGSAGQERGQVAAPLPGVAEPPRVGVGPGPSATYSQSGLRPASHRARGPPASASRPRQPRIRRPAASRPVQQGRKQLRRKPQAAGHGRGQPFGQQVGMLAADQPAQAARPRPGSPRAWGPAHRRAAARRDRAAGPPGGRRSAARPGRAGRPRDRPGRLPRGAGRGCATAGTTLRSVPIRLAVTRSCHVLKAVPPSRPGPRRSAATGRAASTRRPPSAGGRRTARAAASSRPRPGAAAGHRRPRRTGRARGARAGVASSTAGQVSSQGSSASAAAYPASNPATVAPGGGPPGAGVVPGRDQGAQRDGGGVEGQVGVGLGADGQRVVQRLRRPRRS